MLEQLNMIVGWVFSRLTDILQLYLEGSVLTGVFALWFLRRIAKLFDKLR